MPQETFSPHLRKIGLPSGFKHVEVQGNRGQAAFALLDHNVRSGASLTAVFFGASLTWGTNANDPERTSYRALMGTYLRDRYPHSRVACHDASIGGTGSKLGLFRLERDVLRYHPDLVFLDFTANDGIDSADAAGLASYERILHELISRGICVVQMFFAFAPNFSAGKNPADLPRQRAHQRLAQTYGTAVGDTVAHVHQALGSGRLSAKEIWPFDSTHPGDAGYQLYFEAARQGLEAAIDDLRVCIVPPEPVYPARFACRTRIAAVDLPAPPGWRREHAYRTSAFFDGLSSRWIDDVLAFSGPNQPIEPLRVEFEGSMVGILGEADPDGLGARFVVDGHALLRGADSNQDQRIWAMDTKRFGGRLIVWRELSDHLPPGKHVLEIHPVVPAGATGQLRIESICAAGE